MRAWAHALAIVAGIAAPVALTFWTTSASGPRNAAQSAEIAQETMTPKQVVEAFERLAFDEGNPTEAVRRYVSKDVIDHSQRIAGDYDSIIELLVNLDWTNGRGPKRTIQHMVAEGDIVMVHYHLVREPGTPGFAAVDIFRVQGGKIVEHWEALQPLPDISSNKHGPF